MQIFVYIYPILIARTVLGFHDWFLNFLFGGFVLMDFLTFLKHLTADCKFGCGFMLFGGIKQVSENLGVFLLFAFGLKVLYSDWFSRVLIQLLCDLRGKSVELRNGFCLNNVIDRKLGILKFSKEDSLVDEPLLDKTEEIREKSDFVTDSDVNINAESDEECDADSEIDSTVEDEGFDVTELRKLIKTERRRANAAMAELQKERAASATAAEEAMAMILRLQNEKSVMEMELNQYRRLAEENQIHDQQVIQSLQWLLLRHEFERDSLQNQLNLCNRRLQRLIKSGESEEVEEASSSFNGNISDALENVFYSSRDANSSIE